MQRYLCLDCKKNFQSEKRPQKLQQVLWKKYTHERNTLKNLSGKYHKSINWVRNQLLEARNVKKKTNPTGLVMVADVTFFGRGYGFIVFRSPSLRKNLYYKNILYETISEYAQGRYFLERQGFTLSAIVLDGKPGVRKVFSDIPIQMCHFHQKQIIRRYLTNNPKLEVAIELKELVRTLCTDTKSVFTARLLAWHSKWELFLKERTVNLETGKWHYTHRRVRAAYKSLQANLPYLFTYQEYPGLNIPNTTNSLDGSFANLKDLVGVHRGFNEILKRKIIEEILEN